ncbi:hypothetical protein QQF64_028096 [Cirrhinus molitorella]|uniref:Uncharacterized protein n=1 Tax=Cirrhinus molitorella TaxID=172907 RepID=A0ABR3N5M3_9TELE
MDRNHTHAHRNTSTITPTRRPGADPEKTARSGSQMHIVIRLLINITAALPAKYERTPAISYVGGLRQMHPQTRLQSALQSTANKHPNVV